MILSWEDKEVSFDVPYSEMRLKLGETIIDKLDSIEDTKGNAGDRGRVIITNLRILWHSLPSPRINLSIGFNCIVTINTKVVNSKARGTTHALHLLTLSEGTRYEFVFTSLVQGNMRLFTSVVGVHKAYVTSKFYRELRLRAGVVYNKKLKILPLEQVISNTHGVWNLSSDQGSLGTFIVTNIRFVWFADINEGFNISLPYLQVQSVGDLYFNKTKKEFSVNDEKPQERFCGLIHKKECEAERNKDDNPATRVSAYWLQQIRIRDSKFGKALVVESTERSGNFILGFKVDPEEKLLTINKELTSLRTVFLNNPIYGVEYKWKSNSKVEEQKQDILDDLEVIEDPKNEIGNTLSAYLADEGHKVDRLPVYSDELGLAVEAIKDGYSLKKLWEVIPSN